ncbi:MAG: hypothetical protein JSW10_10835 [Pseudomonadota bacterium]|nr:MAG: hypothetical protein JSW10_10835 [Pseudomonadota bacterium]
MQPYVYLNEVAAAIETLENRETLNATLDELEFIYEALDPEFQELASELIAKLSERL